MSRTYRTEELSFEYPADWQASEERGEEGLTVTLSGDETAFCTITLLEERPGTENVLDAGVDAYREIYDDFDVEPMECEIAGRPAQGRNVDFFCMELISSAWLRAFRTGRFTVLIVFQAEGREAASGRETLQLICNSMDCDADVVAGESRAGFTGG